MTVNNYYEWRCGACGSAARIGGSDVEYRDRVLEFAERHRCAGRDSALAETKLAAVEAVLAHARQVSPSDRAVIYAADIERALGRGTSQPRKVGMNDA